MTRPPQIRLLKSELVDLLNRALDRLIQVVADATVPERVRQACRADVTAIMDDLHGGVVPPSNGRSRPR